mgnify:CR=1 FL=1
MYYLRLDDASEYMMQENWLKMQDLLYRYNIKPLFGIIPNNRSDELCPYGKVDDFYSMVQDWISHGWMPALHGYDHVYLTREGGINPVNKKSEFAGVDYSIQKEKIIKGVAELEKHNIDVKVFFAPAHTYDENTLKVLHEYSNIRIISDTIATDTYYDIDNDFYFIPLQSGHVKALPFKTTTFCYHPNTMEPDAFLYLSSFIEQHREKFGDFSNILLNKRKYTAFDTLLSKAYFFRHAIKNN